MRIINPLDIFRPRLLEDIDTYFERNKKPGKPAPKPEDEFLLLVLRLLRLRPREWRYNGYTIRYNGISIWVKKGLFSLPNKWFRLNEPFEMYLHDHDLCEELLREVEKIVFINTVNHE